MRNSTVRNTCCVISVLLLATICVGAQPVDSDPFQADAQAARKQIIELGKTGNASELIAMKEIVSRNWKSRSLEHYGELMRQICTEIRSIRGQRIIDYEAIHSIAREALETYDPDREENISVETHYWLVIHLQAKQTYPKGKMSDAEWKEERRLEAERWMVAWKRLEEAVDPDFNPDELVSIKAMPPAETQLPPGVSPDVIEDPKLRIEYELAIGEIHRIAQYRNEQHRLKDLKRSFTSSLAWYYGQTAMVIPYEKEELSSYLEAHIQDAEVRETILKAVEEKNRRE